jgi:hypothetical protein
MDARPTQRRSGLAQAESEQFDSGLRAQRWRLAAFTLGASNAALADGDHHPKYGGVVTVVKDVQYELVTKADSVAIFIDDHGKKVDTKGAAAKLTLFAGGEKTEIAFVPVGENGFESKGAFKVPAGTKALATIVLAGKPAINARFEIK